MSNIDTVKEMYAAFSRGDVAGIMAHVADDVLWEAEGPAELKFTGIRRGKNDTLGFFTAIGDEHQSPVLNMTEFLSSGDSVAAFGRYACTLTRSGKWVDTPIAHLFKFKNGKVVQYTNLFNTAAFVEASRAAKA